MTRIARIAGFVILAGITSVRGFAQQPGPVNLPIDPDTKKIQYRGVVDQAGTPAYLYDKAIEWFRAYYVNPTSVYNVQDKANGKIEGTGRMKIYYSDEAGTRIDAGQVLYSIKVELKENKYRYTLTDFTFKATSRYPVEKWMNKSDPAYNPQWDSYLYQIDTTMQNLIVRMKAGMKPTVKKTDEW